MLAYELCLSPGREVNYKFLGWQLIAQGEYDNISSGAWVNVLPNKSEIQSAEGINSYIVYPIKFRSTPLGSESSDVLSFALNTSADINTLSQVYVRKYIDNSFPQFEKDFVSSSRGDVIESGNVYEFESIFEAHRQKGIIAAAKMLSKLLQKYYGDVHIVKAILHTVSHYSYSELGGDFVSEVAALCHHENKGIKKFALKVFDNWEAIETLDVLKHIEPLKEKWLEEYRREIVRHLEQIKGEHIDVVSC